MNRGGKMDPARLACLFCPNFIAGRAKGLGMHSLMRLSRPSCIFTGFADTSIYMTFVFLGFKSAVPARPPRFVTPHFLYLINYVTFN